MSNGARAESRRPSLISGSSRCGRSPGRPHGILLLRSLWSWPHYPTCERPASVSADRDALGETAVPVPSANTHPCCWHVARGTPSSHPWICPGPGDGGEQDVWRLCTVIPWRAKCQHIPLLLAVALAPVTSRGHATWTLLPVLPGIPILAHPGCVIGKEVIYGLCLIRLSQCQVPTHTPVVGGGTGTACVHRPGDLSTLAHLPRSQGVPSTPVSRQGHAAHTPIRYRRHHDRPPATMACHVPTHTPVRGTWHAIRHASQRKPPPPEDRCGRRGAPPRDAKRSFTA